MIAVCGEWFTCSGVHLVGASAHAAYDPLRGSFSSGTWGFLMVGASILGALAMSSEYSSRLIRTTFLAVPDRQRVVLAKAVVLVIVTSLLGMVTAIASFVTAQAILSGEQLGISISRPAVASTAILPVCAVIGIAVGTLIRTPVATLFTAVLFPVLLGKAPSSSNQLTAALSNSAPQNAWSSLSSLRSEWDNVGPVPHGTPRRSRDPRRSTATVRGMPRLPMRPHRDRRGPRWCVHCERSIRRPCTPWSACWG
ncbi:ABC transporter permease subunit [Streptomyces sp. NPDC004008]